MVIFVDIDKTICHTDNLPTELKQDYSLAQPIKKHIQKINSLFDMGHTIVYWTARGSITGIDWQTTTFQQFKKWGVKYHEIRFGKPPYDIFIDDKACTIENLDVFNIG